MISPPRSGRAAPLCVSLCLSLGIALILTARLEGRRRDADAADLHTLVITSDSTPYCRTLCEAIDARGKLPYEVSVLREQGDAMCREGQVRGGLSRLRRALLVLQGARSGDPRSQGAETGNR